MTEQYGDIQLLAIRHNATVEGAEKAYVACNEDYDFANALLSRLDRIGCTTEDSYEKLLEFII